MQLLNFEIICAKYHNFTFIKISLQFLYSFPYLKHSPWF
jgi:hypothetical protein